jgi:hypothetical protein
VIDRLTTLQLRRPWAFIGSALVLAVIAGGFALQLHLLTGFESLLPESKPSVKELKRVSSLTNGVSTVFVVLEGGEKTPVTALRQAADALVPAIKAIGAPWVGHAESGVHESLEFLSPRAGLFLKKDRLDKLRADVDERYAKAVGEGTGLFVDLGDDETADAGAPKQNIDFASLRDTLSIEGADPDRYPDGYYQSKDGKQVVVLVRSKVPSGDFDRGNEVLEKLRATVEQVNVKKFDAGITVGYAGDLETSVTEFMSINRDLTEVGVLGAIMIAAVVLLYYLRMRMVVLLLVTIGIGVSWTFGMTELTVGRLNIATGFLFTIIAGNGINFGIIYLARYLEARRTLDVAKSMNASLRDTWVPTLTAAAAAGASYGSLGATDFRGFHDFGVIGGVGMMLCWVATYWALPSLLAVTEQWRPLDAPTTGLFAPLRKLAAGGSHFGAPFVWVVSRYPRAIALVGVALSLAGVAAGVFWVKADPMEYDLRNLRTDVSHRANEMRLDNLGNTITGHVGANGMAILVDDAAQVPQLEAVLNARRDAAPEGEKPFLRLHALQDFVPEGQAERIPTLLHIRSRLLRARAHGAISDADWARLEPVIPPADLKPFGMADLPEAVARAFTETDGTRGRIVYISPVSTRLVDDAHYLFRWADSYREAPLPGGKTVLGSGRAVIYADMWQAVVEDVPKAVLLSFGATVLVVLIAFRGGRSTVAVLGTLLAGVAWTMGLLVILGVKLNFLNFIALPITFGIGVDYSVNVVQRYVREGRGSALLAIQETGGAVILCSMTTTLGYLALVKSINFGVRSLGIAAFLGEVCCLLASVLVLPAVLMWIDGRRVVSPIPAPAE